MRRRWFRRGWRRLGAQRRAAGRAAEAGDLLAATDVISLDRAKDALGHSAGDPTQDALLAAYITAASREMDRRYGPVIARSVTERLDGGVPNARTGSWLAGRSSRIRCRYWPLISVTSVTEYTSGTSAVLTAETASASGDYLAELWDDPELPAGLSGWLVRRRGFQDAWWATGRQNVTVVTSAGRFASTAAAQGSRWERAAEVVLRWWWHAQDLGVAAAGSFEVPSLAFPTSWPNFVDQLLSDARHDFAVA